MTRPMLAWLGFTLLGIALVQASKSCAKILTKSVSP
jgi:hypothetical protein